MRRLRPLWGLFLLLLLLVPAPRAEAHAVVLGSTPINGERLTRAPLVVALRFNEAVEAEFNPLVVRDRTGARVDTGDPELSPDKTTLSVGLKPNLPDGFYTASYRITSLDGHPVQGAISFTTGAAQAGAPAGGTSPDNAAEVPVGPGLLHGAVAVVATVLAGLSFFLVWVWWPAAGDRPAPPARLAWGLAVVLAVLALGEVAVYAVRASGDAFSPGLLAQALVRSRTGRLWYWRAGLAFVTAWALAFVGPNRPDWLKGLAPLPGGFLLLSLTWQSHAMATQQLLPVLADWGHLLALAPWVGGLIGFLVVVRPVLTAMAGEDRQELLTRVVPRFSRLAIGAVAVLVITGTYAATLHIASWEELTQTAYGWTLLAKVFLLVPVMALAAFNLFRRGRGPFLRAVLGEVVILVVIFAAAGLLSSMAPAGVQLAVKHTNVTTTATQDGLQISLHINPSKVGSTQPEIRLTAGGAPVAGANVGLRVNMIEDDMGLQNIDAKEISPGVYQADPVIFGMDGHWRIEVVILTKEGREVRHPFIVTVVP